MLTHSQDFITLESSIRKENKVCTPYGRCFAHAGIEETAEIISSGRFLLHASSTIPWKFTIPRLDGSMPLHSFVTLIQGVETDSV
jgi:hypothetical protein